MPAAVAYDVTRLATRVLSVTPNGIDRIDFAFARHFLALARQDASGIMMTALGPRAIRREGARDIVEGIAIHWGEEDSPDQDETYRRIVEWTLADGSRSDVARRATRGRSGRAVGVMKWIGQHGFPIGRSPAAALPSGARYLNASQFPLWISSYFGWLNKRPDVKAVFFIHDLLPIEAPEYFPAPERERHLRRLENLARFGAGAIVTTNVVRAALQSHLRKLGRGAMPIHLAPIPAAPIFRKGREADPTLAGHPYFIACSTIEPRKNHLMLLHVWRELARRGGPAPRLILIGSRGWENENVVDLLERCDGIRGHVFEAQGISTPSVKKLLDGACALLMPSFAEGCGLPIVEALAAHAPVIASDIPAFQEIGDGRIVALSPIDGEKWLETIRAFASPDSPQRRAAQALVGGHEPASWDRYFGGIEEFLESL